MMKNTFKKFIIKGFTLVEIMISTFISMIILSFIFMFLSNTIEEIGSTEQESKALSSFYDITNKINNLRNVYVTGGILVETSTGSDVFLMEDSNGENGILIAPVDILTSYIELDNMIYKDKGVGFRKVSKAELDDIEISTDVIYDYIFQKDQIFSDLNINEMIFLSYNSGSIIDLTLVMDIDFRDTLVGSSRLNLPRDSLKRFNIDF